MVLHKQCAVVDSEGCNYPYGGVHNIFIVAVLALVAVLWASIQWYRNQRKLDAKLDAEVGIKILEYRRIAAKYEGDIAPLTKNEDILLGLDIIRNVQRGKVKRRIKEHQRNK